MQMGTCISRRTAEYFRTRADSQEACNETSSSLVFRNACTVPYFVLGCIEIWGHMSCLYHLAKCVDSSRTRECHCSRCLDRACRINVPQALALTPLSRQVYDAALVGGRTFQYIWPGSYRHACVLAEPTQVVDAVMFGFAQTEQG